MTNSPFISVIIVNYNGKHFLSGCLDALQNQTYPANSFNVIVSDNGSSDGSIEFIKRHYPWVDVLENQSNLGFASGNNAAIRYSQGKYVVLLNNDTVPQPSWLESIVRVAEENPKSGIVTGRLQLFYNQLTIELQSDTYAPPGDGRDLGIQLYSIDSDAPYGVIQFLNGFYGYEDNQIGDTFRWTKSKAVLGIPVPSGSGNWFLLLKLAAARPDNRSVSLQITIKNTNPDNHNLIFSGIVSGSEPQTFRLEIPDFTRGLSLPVIQNTGSIIFHDGASRDRGTFVQDNEIIYESDLGQYSKIEEIFSGCGANLLLRKEMLEEIGLFDDDFFMYYEDTDLSWRARLWDWSILYAPDAIVRHFHCGTSKEWSPLFLFLIERNRLAMVIKNGSWQQVMWTLVMYLGRTTINIFSTILAFIFHRPNRHILARWSRHNGRVLKYLIVKMPSLIHKRINIQKNRRLPPSLLKVWFLKKS